jgi:hypothetical protein
VPKEDLTNYTLDVRAAELGWGKEHSNLGNIYHGGGNMKKAKFHGYGRRQRDKKQPGDSWRFMMET